MATSTGEKLEQIGAQDDYGQASGRRGDHAYSENGSSGTV